MDADLRRRWVEALRSGRYRQGLNVLCKIVDLPRDTSGKQRSERRYCCLGVLCDVIDPSGWIKTDDGRPDREYWKHAGTGHTGRVDLPSELKSQLGIYDTSRYMAMNDEEHLSFEAIADRIESEP